MDNFVYHAFTTVVTAIRFLDWNDPLLHAVVLHAFIAYFEPHIARLEGAVNKKTSSLAYALGEAVTGLIESNLEWASSDTSSSPEPDTDAPPFHAQTPTASLSKDAALSAAAAISAALGLHFVDASVPSLSPAAAARNVVLSNNTDLIAFQYPDVGEFSEYTLFGQVFDMILAVAAAPVKALWGAGVASCHGAAPMLRFFLSMVLILCASLPAGVLLLVSCVVWTGASVLSALLWTGRLVVSMPVFFLHALWTAIKCTHWLVCELPVELIRLSCSYILSVLNHVFFIALPSIGSGLVNLLRVFIHALAAFGATAVAGIVGVLRIMSEVAASAPMGVARAMIAIGTTTRHALTFIIADLARLGRFSVSMIHLAFREVARPAAKTALSVAVAGIARFRQLSTLAVHYAAAGTYLFAVKVRMTLHVFFYVISVPAAGVVRLSVGLVWALVAELGRIVFCTGSTTKLAMSLIRAGVVEFVRSLACVLQAVFLGVLHAFDELTIAMRLTLSFASGVCATLFRFSTDALSLVLAETARAFVDVGLMMKLAAASTVRFAYSLVASLTTAYLDLARQTFNVCATSMKDLFIAFTSVLDIAQTSAAALWEGTRMTVPVVAFYAGSFASALLVLAFVIVLAAEDPITTFLADLMIVVSDHIPCAPVERADPDEPVGIVDSESSTDGDEPVGIAKSESSVEGDVSESVSSFAAAHGDVYVEPRIGSALEGLDHALDELGDALDDLDGALDELNGALDSFDGSDDALNGRDYVSDQVDAFQHRDEAPLMYYDSGEDDVSEDEGSPAPVGDPLPSMALIPSDDSFDLSTVLPLPPPGEAFVASRSIGTPAGSDQESVLSGVSDDECVPSVASDDEGVPLPFSMRSDTAWVTLYSDGEFDTDFDGELEAEEEVEDGTDGEWITTDGSSDEEEADGAWVTTDGSSDEAEETDDDTAIPAVEEPEFTGYDRTLLAPAGFHVHLTDSGSAVAQQEAVASNLFADLDERLSPEERRVRLRAGFDSIFAQDHAVVEERAAGEDPDRVEAAVLQDDFVHLEKPSIQDEDESEQPSVDAPPASDASLVVQPASSVVHAPIVPPVFGSTPVQAGEESSSAARPQVCVTPALYVKVALRSRGDENLPFPSPLDLGSSPPRIHVPSAKEVFYSAENRVADALFTFPSVDLHGYAGPARAVSTGDQGSAAPSFVETTAANGGTSSDDASATADPVFDGASTPRDDDDLNQAGLSGYFAFKSSVHLSEPESAGMEGFEQLSPASHFAHAAEEQLISAPSTRDVRSQSPRVSDAAGSDQSQSWLQGSEADTSESSPAMFFGTRADEPAFVFHFVGTPGEGSADEDMGRFSSADLDGEIFDARFGTESQTSLEVGMPAAARQSMSPGSPGWEVIDEDAADAANIESTESVDDAEAVEAVAQPALPGNEHCSIKGLVAELGLDEQLSPALELEEPITPEMVTKNVSPSASPGLAPTPAQEDAAEERISDVELEELRSFASEPGGLKAAETITQDLVRRAHVDQTVPSQEDAVNKVAMWTPLFPPQAAKDRNGSDDWTNVSVGTPEFASNAAKKPVPGRSISPTGAKPAVFSQGLSSAFNTPASKDAVHPIRISRPAIRRSNSPSRSFDTFHGPVPVGPISRPTSVPPSANPKTADDLPEWPSVGLSVDDSRLFSPQPVKPPPGRGCVDAPSDAKGIHPEVLSAYTLSASEGERPTIPVLRLLSTLVAGDSDAPCTPPNKYTHPHDVDSSPCISPASKSDESEEEQFFEAREVLAPLSTNEDEVPTSGDEFESASETSLEALPKIPAGLGPSLFLRPRVSSASLKGRLVTPQVSTPDIGSVYQAGQGQENVSPGSQYSSSSRGKARGRKSDSDVSQHVAWHG